MTTTAALHAESAGAPFERTTIDRRDLRADDECQYCLSGEEQFCTTGVVLTGIDEDRTYERIAASEVRYRAVIEAATFDA